MRSTPCLAAVFSILILGVMGCSDVNAPAERISAPRIGPLTMIEPCGESKTVTLWAGQFIDAGSVTVTNDESVLSVEIVAAEGWYLTESHVAVAYTMEDLPQTGSGNPKVGHFDFSVEHDPPVSEYTYLIDIPEYGYQFEDSLVMAVHAIVKRIDETGAVLQTETGWADGPEFPGSSWATYMYY